MLQAIFFDRDGTLGGDGHFCHPSDFQLYPQADRALRLARAAGLKLFAVTNQHRISAAAAEHGLDLARCAVIGDVGATDVLAANAIGAVKVLVRTGWGEGSLGDHRHTWAETEPDHVAAGVLEAVEWLLDERCGFAVTADYGGPVRLSWRPGADLPPLEQTTSVHGYCFHNGQVLLGDLNTRGFDIPGGHREPGETAEECFRRETLEEGCVQGGPCTPIGYLIVDNTHNPSWRPGGKYPQVGYQLFYHMPVTAVLPFEARFESSRRIFVDPADLPKHYHGWTGLGGHILRAAVAVEHKGGRNG